MKNRQVLLINPWIADFAAYDLWAKPLGPLYIGKFLREYNYELELIDLTDRLHWGPFDTSGKITSRGKYHKTIIRKPDIVAHVPRRFGLYGATLEQFRAALSDLKTPLAILITSQMSYWYPGLIETVAVLREQFADITILLGGTYATLFPEHARKSIKPDYLITGYGEKETLKILDEVSGLSRDYQQIPNTNDRGSLPWDLYPNLKTVGILTSRGCPLNCDYCATKFLNPHFLQRPVSDISSEILELQDKYHVKDIAFYDDALLVNRKKHIIPILKKLISRNIHMKFHTPNGLFARDIDSEMAELMRAAGFTTIRLGLESIIPKFQKSSSYKVSTSHFENALIHLENAGYHRKDIETYLIMGLPGQQYTDVEKTINYVAEQGAISRLAAYTPIPHTQTWEIARQMGYIDDDIDPLLTNNTLYPCANENFPVEKFAELRQISNDMNSKIRNFLPESPNLGSN